MILHRSLSSVCQARTHHCAAGHDRGRSVATDATKHEQLLRGQRLTPSPFTEEETRVLGAVNDGVHPDALPHHLDLDPLVVQGHLRAAAQKTGTLAPGYAAELAAELGWLPAADGASP